MKTAINYIVENNGYWFCVRAASIALARREGREEFGRNTPFTVKRANKTDVAAFLAIKGAESLSEVFP